MINKSSGISIGCSGGTLAPPVFPSGMFPTKDFTPPTNRRGICPIISFVFLVLMPNSNIFQCTKECAIG
jgi:hypothetical protein